MSSSISNFMRHSRALRRRSSVLVVALAIGVGGSLLSIPSVVAQDATANPIPDTPLLDSSVDSSVDDADSTAESAMAVPLGLGRLPEGVDPAPPARIELGRRLFFDKGLSADGSTSCGSCHQPQHGFAAPLPIAEGTAKRRGVRNAPSLLNRAWGKVQFWDGREQTLETQALRPILTHHEFGSTLERALSYLRSHPHYPLLFARAFATTDDDASGDATRHSLGQLITPNNFAVAIASFERTLLYGNSTVDRFQGGEYKALDDAARRGLWIYESRGRCWRCHSGPNFSDESFHNNGVGFESQNRDRGRGGVTENPDHEFQFKTPTLRGVAHTAPYMHNGSIETLEEVVRFYARGITEEPDPKLDPAMADIVLSEQDIQDLVAFLEALSPELPKHLLQQ